MSQVAEKRRTQAVSLLKAAALKFDDLCLSALAVQARMDAFGNLKKTIQTMVDRLLKEKDDEVKKKDFCVDQLNKNSRETADKNTLKADLEAKIAALKAAVDQLAKDIAALEATMADLSQQLKIQ